MVADVVGLADETRVDGEAATGKLDCADREITRSVRRWVRRAKLHFGEVKDSAADQLCVKRWLAEQMKAEDMREKDARGLIPIVAYLASVPDADDITANFIRHSSVVKHARFLGGAAPVH